MDSHLTSSRWSSLPRDLIANIAKRLPTRSDTLCFLAACRAFRASIPLPPKPFSPHSHLKLPFPIGQERLDRFGSDGHLLLTLSTVYTIEPLKQISKTRRKTTTWLVKVEESKTGKVIIKDPFDKTSYVTLTKKLPENLNLLDYRVKEIAKGYGLAFVANGEIRSGDNIEFNRIRMVKKAVVSSSIDEIDDEFAVMVIIEGDLGVWRNGDKKWTIIKTGHDRVFFDDIIYHDKKFYAVDTMGGAIIVDPKSLNVTKVATRQMFGHFKYLVKSLTDVFLVAKALLNDYELFLEGSYDDEYYICLNLFKLDEKKCQWIPVVDGLGDRVFFIGDDCSFSISANEFSGFKRNCVYFADIKYYEIDDDYPGWDAGIFNMEDGIARPLSAFPRYCKIFWPPPSWLKQDSSFLRPLISATTRQWHSLPKDLLASIARCLPTRSDVVSFRAVCNSFRSSIRLPPKPFSPHLSLKLPFPSQLNTSLPGHLLLTQSTVYAIEPLHKISQAYETTKTWIVRAEESNSGKVYIKDPFYGYYYRNLSEKLPKALNLLDYRVKEITKAYGIEFVPDCDGKTDDADVNGVRLRFKKAVVSSCLGEIGDGLAVMAIHTPGKLVVWRKGEKVWNYIDIDRDRLFFTDIVYYNNKFYALDASGLAITVDPLSLNVTEVAAPKGARGDETFLVTGPKDLFLVIKPFYDDYEGGYVSEEDSDGENFPINMFVFKLDEEKREWVQARYGLEDKVMLVGHNCSFCISAKEYPGCRRNSVYFSHDVASEIRDDHPGWCAGIFDLEDETAGLLSSYPGYSKIFWPPPTWLKQNSVSSHS